MVVEKRDISTTHENRSTRATAAPPTSYRARSSGSRQPNASSAPERWTDDSSFSDGGAAAAFSHRQAHHNYAAGQQAEETGG